MGTRIYMTLTLSYGPLAKHPTAEANYQITGPDRRLLFETFPRRVRAVFGGETLADTRGGKLLHESGLLPVLYIPDGDLREDLLEPTDHTTYCPYKGDASYWSVTVGDLAADNAIWAYPDPPEEARWLRGFKSITWEAMEAWYDEDEQIPGHLRDPYHRVDVRRTSRHVRVLHDNDVIAESDRPALLSETGLPNRYYLPPDDVVDGWLTPSTTTAICPYKGTASYWALVRDGRTIAEDVAWSYPDPLENALKAKDHVSFLHDELMIEVDGERIG